MKIILVTGSVNSGKSTFLWNWFNGLTQAQQERIGGFVCLPLFDSGNKIYQVHELSTRDTYPLMSDDRSQPGTILDCHYLLDAAFERMNRRIREDLRKYDTLLIDELGLLELQGMGLAEEITAALTQDKTLVIVVRKKIVESSKKKYFSEIPPGFIHEFQVEKGGTQKEFSDLVLSDNSFSLSNKPSIV
ncbi:MAG: nucleoside-triphosphatase [Candidatus Wallbacteria bacterium]|nr:nucleoside-triphosphatase [Candidatus Wallbacteria bacterium]